jgi:hypothetical protein
MKEIKAFITFDGKVHTSHSSAVKHLDAEYTSIICKIAAEIVSIDKYQDIKNYIDDNLLRFVSAHKIKTDMNTIDGE